MTPAMPDRDPRAAKGGREREPSPAGTDVEGGPPDYEAVEAVGRDSSEAGPGAEGSPVLPLLGYLAIGVFLGFVFVLSEVVSWYRIQEMFRFQSFHMYGIIGSAVVVSALSLQLIRRLGLRTVRGEPIRVTPKEWGSGRPPAARYWIGGTLFGVGWALLGACPGPIFALLGSGITVMVVAVIAAMAGTWAYAALRSVLPH